MFRDLIELTSALTGAKSEKAWFDALANLGRGYGFDYTLFSILPRPGLNYADAYIINNYPSDWVQFYLKQGLAQVDPLIRHVMAQSMPLVWGEGSFVSPAEHHLFDAASAAGVRSGVILPVHGPNHEVGMLSLASGRHLTTSMMKDLSLRLPGLAWLRDVAFDTAREYIERHLKNVVPKLTKREKECLKWMACGKSTWEISQILSCSEATVNFHMANIRNKMGVTSRAAAVFKAARIGIVDCA